MHIIPEFSHRASLADLQLICKPTVRLCNQRLWVYLQKSFLWREPYQTHCGDTFATDLAFRSRCITTECHRWRCRLIPRTGPGHSLGAPRGDFFTFPAQNLAYGMRYNARDCGVQLSVNLISRLEEEGPTRLYACQSGFEPTTKRFKSRALVSSATREAPWCETYQDCFRNLSWVF